MITDLLDTMRDAVSQTLTTSILVRRRTRSRTSTGGSSYTWADAGPVLGRFMATSNQEMAFAEKMGIAATHVAILPYNTAVAVDDILQVAGVDYPVTGVVQHADPVLIKVLCARVEE